MRVSVAKGRLGKCCFAAEWGGEFGVQGHRESRGTQFLVCLSVYR